MAKGGKGDLGRKYLRAAAQRLVAVEFLFNAELYFEAVYLAGYVIECSFKAMILSRVLPLRREEYAKARLVGRTGHDFNFLRSRLSELGIESPGEIVRDLRRMDWTTNLRYEVGKFDRREANDFISTARGVFEWAQRST